MVIIAPVQAHHVDAVAALFEEMDRFYGDATVGTREERAAQIADTLFGAAPVGSALLAWDGSELVGVASYSFLWPAAGVTRSLYLKELYVGQAHRRKGTGRLLMDAVVETAKQHRCGRVEWTTDDANRNARRFYDELGAAVTVSKVFYRVELDANST
jgi:GNAT superfamily N-acetyltransferase